MNGGIVNQWLPVVVTSLITSIASVLASNGFWARRQSRDTSKDAMGRLLMGLAYEKIQVLGMSYINRGWIALNEYEDLRKYLYEPYRDFGGNGVAEQIMLQVSRLPMRSTQELAYSVIINAKRDEVSNAVERQDLQSS